MMWRTGTSITVDFTGEMCISIHKTNKTTQHCIRDGRPSFFGIHPIHHYSLEHIYIYTHTSTHTHSRTTKPIDLRFDVNHNKNDTDFDFHANGPWSFSQFKAYLSLPNIKNPFKYAMRHKYFWLCYTITQSTIRLQTFSQIEFGINYVDADDLNHRMHNNLCLCFFV